MESTIYTVGGRDFELQHHGVKGMKWGVRKKSKPYVQDLGGGVSAVWPSKKAYKKAERQRIKNEKKLEAKSKVKSNESAMKRGAKAIGTVLQVAGSAYAIDMAYTGGAVTRAATKAGKAAVKSTLNKVGDQMFDYSILDKDGKVLRRYN